MLRLTLCVALATLAILFNGLPATNAQVGAPDFCLNNTFAPIVDSMNYPQGEAGYYSDIGVGEALGELFITGDTPFQVMVARVAAMVSNNNDTTSNATAQGAIEIWSDDGAGYPKSLPANILASFGTFTPLGAAPAPVGLDVQLLNFYLLPNTYYWFVIRGMAGGIRWYYSDFAFQNGCPPPTEGRIGGRYAVSDANTTVTWDSVNLDTGYISFFSVDRSCNETLPLPSVAPSPSILPSAIPSPPLSTVPSPPLSAIPSPPLSAIPSPPLSAIPSPPLPSTIPSPPFPSPVPSPPLPGGRGDGRARRVRSTWW